MDSSRRAESGDGSSDGALQGGLSAPDAVQTGR